MNKEWGTDQGYATMKAPTCLLLNPNKSFNSFGYEAQDRFAELEEEEAREYYFFEKFKMVLHKDEVIHIYKGPIFYGFPIGQSSSIITQIWCWNLRGIYNATQPTTPILSEYITCWLMLLSCWHYWKYFAIFSIRTWIEKLLWRQVMGEMWKLWPYSHIQYIISTRKLLKLSGRELVMKTLALVMCSGCWLCRQSGSQQLSNSWEKQHIK